MIKISEVVQELVNRDDFAKVALGRGIINFSQYARELHPHVEAKIMQPVSLQTIVVSLTRIATMFETQQKHQFSATLVSLSVQTDLVQVAFERTVEYVDRIRKTYAQYISSSRNFSAMTEGVHEITIIGERASISTIAKKLQPLVPIFQATDLAGVTVKFPLDYFEIPNVIYSFLSKLAIQSINLYEIVSTPSELTFIIHKKDTQIAVEQLMK